MAVSARRKLRNNGSKINYAASQQLKTLQEGIKNWDVLLDRSQPRFIETYRGFDTSQRQLQANNLFIGAFPRYTLEALGLVLIAIFAWSLMARSPTSNSSTTIIPLLGAFALGTQRILPALQQIYSGWATSRVIMNVYTASCEY